MSPVFVDTSALVALTDKRDRNHGAARRCFRGLARSLRSRAWDLFAEYSDRTFSFTDCTSFALMKSMGLEEAFTFDRRDFGAAGFSVIPVTS